MRMTISSSGYVLFVLNCKLLRTWKETEEMEWNAPCLSTQFLCAFNFAISRIFLRSLHLHLLQRHLLLMKLVAMDESIIVHF
jgi:hypothetical protein